MPLRSPHVIRRKPYTKKVPVVKFALVAFKDDLSCGVFPVGELKGPKSLVPGATVRVMIPGGLKKGSVVTLSENEQALNLQAPVFDVCGFFGFSLKRHPVRGSKGKINLAVKMASDIVTSTPSNNKRSNSLMSSNPPSPIIYRNDAVMSHQDTNASQYLPYFKNMISKDQRSLTSDSSSTKSENIQTSIACRSLVFPDVLTEESVTNISAVPTNPVYFIPEPLLEDVPTNPVYPTRESLIEDVSIPLVQVEYAVSGFFDSTLNKQSLTENNSVICNPEDGGLIQAIADEPHNKNKPKSTVQPSHIATVYNIYNYPINGITKSSLNDEDVSKMILDLKPTATSRNIFTFLKEELHVYPSGTQSDQTLPHQILEESQVEKYAQDPLIHCDFQLTPMEMFHGLKMNCGHPLRIDDLAETHSDILYDIKSVSSKPELFARNMMYRMFSLKELQMSSVYGRGYTNGIRNDSLNVLKVKYIRKLVCLLYKDVKFSWRNCVLWMDKSIKYVRKFM